VSYADGPYYFADLGCQASDEQAAIDGGVISPVGVYYVAARG
jgi:hypothetical protein